jgi:glutamate carboxypeptidase
MDIADLRGWVHQRQPDIEAALRDFVNLNTYTANEAGVDQGMAMLDALCARLSLAVEPVNARHRLITARSSDSGAGHGPRIPRILLISHMDTVFPPDGDFLTYEPLGDGFVRGPGTGDIKGGLLLGLYAMLAAREICAAAGRPYDLQMVVSANEETGSPTIRDWYLAGHTGADYAIGLEPGFPQGPLTPTVPLGVVYQRRGYGAISVKVFGKGTHSGTPWLGLNAVEALAQRIIRIHALSDAERGVSTNVGLVKGGISANTVPGEAEALVSFRFERRDDGERVKAAIEDILRASYLSNPEQNATDRAEYTIDAFIPPMERTEASQVMVDIVLEEAARLGHNVVPIARGGGSDANFTSAAGTPSICGMGAPTDGIHTTGETIYLPMLFERVALLASVLARLSARGKG